jgi:hypothetical protein
VARCSVTESADRRNVLVKVAKSVSGVLSPLTDEERNALTSYVGVIQFAGIPIQVISLNADRLRVGAQVYYNGQYVESVVKAKVIQAVNDFLANLDFNSTVKLTALVDAIQRVEGVDDVKLVEVKGRAQQDSLNAAPAFDRQYVAAAGYLIAEDTASHTLSDTIQMILA